MRYEVVGVRVRDGKKVALILAADDEAEARQLAAEHGIRPGAVRAVAGRPAPRVHGAEEPVMNAAATDPRMLVGGSLSLALLAAGSVWLLSSAGPTAAVEPVAKVAEATGAAHPAAAAEPAATTPEPPAQALVAVEPVPEPVPPPAPPAQAEPVPASPSAVEAETQPALQEAVTGVAQAVEMAGDPADAPYTGQPRAGWLADVEREALQAFGWAYKLDGKVAIQAADFGRLDELATTASAPLARQLQAICSAQQEMAPTEEEEARWKALIENGMQKTQGHLLFGLIDAITGRDPFDNAIDTMNGIAKDARVTEAWQLQRVWLERLLAARDRADRSLAWILDHLEARSDGTAGAPAVTWQFAVEGEQLVLDGRVGTELVGDSVLQIVLHKVQSHGEWTQVSALSGGLARMMGVTALDAAAQIEGTRLAAAQERASNLPLVTTMLLPAAPAGAHFRIKLGSGLGVRDAVMLARAELGLWNQHGRQRLEQVGGLTSLQEAGRKALLAERERAHGRGLFGLFGTGSPPLTKEQAAERVASNLADAAKISGKDQARALRLVADARSAAGDDRALLARCDAVGKPIIAELTRERDGLVKRERSADQELRQRNAALSRDRGNAKLRGEAQAASDALSKVRRELQRVKGLLAIR